VAAWIKAAAKRNGLYGQDGRVTNTPHSAASMVSTLSMASIYSGLEANATLVPIGMAGVWLAALPFVPAPVRAALQSSSARATAQAG